MMNTESTIRLEWYDGEQSILCYTFPDEWTIEDFWNAIRTARQMIRTVDDKAVFAIIILPDRINLPPGFLSTISELQRSNPPNIKLNIVVGGGSFIRTIYRVLNTVVPRLMEQLEMVDTFEDALMRVEEQQASINY